MYEGEWKCNLQDGEGNMLWHTRNELYKGSWVAGAPQGLGEHVWFAERCSGLPFQTLNRYYGEWLAGQRHGHGRFEYADGSQYDGAWKGNRKEGAGVFHFPDGSVFTGAFHEDHMLEGHKSKSTAVYGSNADVVLHIGDLLEESESPEAELKQISNTFLQVCLIPIANRLSPLALALGLSVVARRPSSSRDCISSRD